MFTLEYDRRVLKAEERCSAIVLAAGLSKRMGENKLLLNLGNKTVIEWVVKHILKAGFDPEDVCVVLSSHMFKYDLADVNIHPKVRMVSNPKSHMGQSTSVKLGLEQMSDRKGAFFFLGDQPFIHPTDIEKLKKAAETYDDTIIIPITENGKRGNPVYFPKKNYEELFAVQGDKGGREILGNPINEIKEVAVYNSFIHFDMDTKDDYDEAKKLFDMWG